MVLIVEIALKQEIKAHIQTCREFVQTLNVTIDQNKTILNWFKQLCTQLTNIITFVSNINQKQQSKFEKSTRDILILYCTQLLTSLSLLINVFVRETDVECILKETRYCATKQIVWCQNGIEEALTSNVAPTDPSGSFIKWVDSALEKISEITPPLDEMKKTCTEARILFEEVLSHAMSIAQVALREDCKIIKGSSQTVLEAMDSLTNEINKPDPNGAMVDLFMDTCSDKLCALERKVNTAVLKLSLKVFGDYTKTLDTIHKFCFVAENKSKMEHLDFLVADFDLHVDQIMQIGLFAVSCSTCVNRCVKIRSCLASLEAMESELVPAFNSVLLDPTTHNINHALLLKNHWLQQANTLKQLIYLIIDPFAFCQVIYEEIKQIVELLSETKLLESASQMDQLLKYANVLKSFINSILTEIEQNVLEKVTNSFSDFKNVLHEVHCASSSLLNHQEPNLENSTRILKRCKILLTTIKRLWYLFAEEELQNKSNIIEASPDTQVATGKLNPFLEHIIKRGEQILKDRSIMYRSLKMDQTKKVNNRTDSNKPQIQKKPLALSKLVHLRRLSFMNSMLKNETSIDLQITDILNELTNLSNFSLVNK